MIRRGVFESFALQIHIETSLFKIQKKNKIAFTNGQLEKFVQKHLVEPCRIHLFMKCNVRLQQISADPLTMEAIWYANREPEFDDEGKARVALAVIEE